MGLAKGQMMISGLVLLGLVLMTLSFNVFEFEESENQNKVFENIQDSTPYQVKKKKKNYSGQAFMENFQALTLNYRDRVSAAGRDISYTVVKGEREKRQFKVYTGNFGPEKQEITLNISGQTENFNLTSDETNVNSFSISDKYDLSIEGKYFSRSFEEFDSSFILVHYRYDSEDSIRQDTYIG